MEVKAVACELPRQRAAPLARWSVAELRRAVVAQGIVAQISDTTLWRWLSQDALRPWRYRSWIFPRDPQFALKAGRILDLYACRWQGAPARAAGVRALRRRKDEHPSAAPLPSRAAARAGSTAAGRACAHAGRRVGLYRRLGCASRARVRTLRSQDGHRPVRAARGARHEAGTVSFSAARLLDCGQRLLASGQRAVARLQAKWSKLVLVHTPIHASWLNQIEIYFSVVQRKVLTPNDFPSLSTVRERLLRFQAHYIHAAKPFQWTFTRRDLAALLAKLGRRPVRGGGMNTSP